MADFKLRYGVARAQGSRPYQEDEYTCIDNLTVGKGPALFSVFDGHGSDNVSADASDHVHEKIFNSPFLDTNINEAIRLSFKEEDQHLHKFLNKLRADRAGSTATVIVVTGDYIHCGNVGDSRAIMGMINSSGALTALRLSKDHHLDDPEEKRRILNAGGIVLSGRVVGEQSAINMSRALGDLNFKTPLNRAKKDFISADAFVCEPVKITPNVQFIVLASDGLWNEMDDDLRVALHVDERRHAGLGPDEISRELADKCAKEPLSDNVTVVTVFFDWGGNASIHDSTSKPPGDLFISKHDAPKG